MQRGLIGEVISRLERRGLRLVAAKFMQVSQPLAEEHYAIHKGKPFYEGLINYILSAPVMAMVWEGPNAVAPYARRWAPPVREAAPGTLRHDFALEVGRNITHASDEPGNGVKEIALWFKQGELVDWSRAVDQWIFEKSRERSIWEGIRPSCLRRRYERAAQGVGGGQLLQLPRPVSP